MLGIGGKELSEENAVQTAMALNIIQPDFIRVHATGIKPESKLGEFVRDGSFTLQSEEEIVVEQKLFLQQLHEMDSYYVNEHIINLLLEVRGNLRTEKQEMLSTIDRFLALPTNEKLLFTVGRRLNIFFLFHPFHSKVFLFNRFRNFDDLSDAFLDGMRRNAMFPVVVRLDFAAAIRLVNGASHRIRYIVCVQNDCPLHIPGGAADCLNQGSLAAQESFLIRIQNRNQGNFRQIKPFPQQIDPN